MSLFLTFPPTPNDADRKKLTEAELQGTRGAKSTEMADWGGIGGCGGGKERVGPFCTPHRRAARCFLAPVTSDLALSIRAASSSSYRQEGGPSNKGSRRSCMSGRRNHKPSPGPPNFRTTLPPYADCDDDDPYELGKKNEMRFDSSSGRERRFVWLGQSIVFFNLQARQFR
ncbi:hypothetical protein BDP67DRAFT_491010 [Colletotrichum lupini]|nr:hypothetical protein BDP67DRAFT_491010 [Colletotrichum lupini]